MSQQNNNNKKKMKDPKDIVEEIPEALPSSAQKLFLEPDSLMGVASAYRYKLAVLNPEFERAAFYYDDSMDVFAFTDVNKKRALKKQDWPNEAPLDHPRRYNVKVQLMAGNAEIKSCGGCSMWKEMTKKPFLVLTPHGSRCVEFAKNPFILLIFRCCPKFHSYTKQFSLRVTITHAVYDIVYTTEVMIHRKKMNGALKAGKRKNTEEEEDDEEICEEDHETHAHSHSHAHAHTHDAHEVVKRPRIDPISAPLNLAPKPEPLSNPIFSPSNAFDQSKFNDLESVLALHETLFPHEAKLLKPPTEPFVLAPTDRILNTVVKPEAKPKGAKSFFSQPFQQFQEEYDYFNSHYEQGQQVPQQWATPQQFFDFLYNKKPATPKPADPTVQPVAIKKLLPPVVPVASPIFDPSFAPELNNDEKWLSTVLDDVPFANDLFRYDDMSLFSFEAN